MAWQGKKLHEQLSKTKPKFCETTDAEKTKELSWHADILAPQDKKRVPEGTAQLSKRVLITVADKKKVNKALIDLLVSRSFKLFTYNRRPFVLESTCSLEEARDKYFGVVLNSELNTLFRATRSHFHLACADQPRTSLGGITFNPETDQQSIAPLPHQAPEPSEILQSDKASDGIATPVILDSRLNDIGPELFVKVHTWLDNVAIPTAPEKEFIDSYLDRKLDDEDWKAIRRIVRQRKSLARQILPNIMSTIANNTSVRGSNHSRPSGSYPRPGESEPRTVADLIKDHSGTSVRRPKNMPSGSQLPPCWNDKMDELICHMEAQCDFTIKSIVRALKNRFSELREVSYSILLDEALIDANPPLSTRLRRRPSSVASTHSTIRIILTSRKGPRWLLLRLRQMDTRFHLSILPTILSSTGSVEPSSGLGFLRSDFW